MYQSFFHRLCLGVASKKSSSNLRSSGLPILGISKEKGKSDSYGVKIKRAFVWFPACLMATDFSMFICDGEDPAHGERRSGASQLEVAQCT